MNTDALRSERLSGGIYSTFAGGPPVPAHPHAASSPRQRAGDHADDAGGEHRAADHFGAVSTTARQLIAGAFRTIGIHENRCAGDRRDRTERDDRGSRAVSPAPPAPAELGGVGR